MASEQTISVIGGDTVVDGQTGRDNPGYKYETPSTSFPDDLPAYEEAASLDTDKVAIQVVDNNVDTDEKILAVLRDVVRKCTNTNPAKRPTATEVLKILGGVAPKQLLHDGLDLSGDDEDEGEVKKLK